jgi:predicted transcriptional regulator of viral defense system
MSYRDVLRDLAFDTHGVVTLRDAEDAGIPAVEVRKLANRGALRRLGQGVYRMLEAPTSDLDEFAEAVALVGEGAVLADEGVLSALNLAQVNLRRIPVATTRRVRSKLPPKVQVVSKSVPASKIDNIDGIPAMTVGDAIIASRGRILTERLIDAAHQAAKRGLIATQEEHAIVRELESTA